MCSLEWSCTPSLSSSLSLHSIYLFSNCDFGRSLFIHAAASPPPVCEAHIRHSSPAEFDSITAQIPSHYLSAEYSLNVNVFLGRLHQREILKNIPLIDEHELSSLPPPFWTPHLPSPWQRAYTQSPARTRSGDGAEAGALASIRAPVIWLIRAHSCPGRASVTPYINTEQTCS